MYLACTSLMPRPHLSWGKGCGDNRAISWLCQVSSTDFEQTCLDDVWPISLAYVHTRMMWHYSIGLSKIKTADSVQPRNRSIVTRRFSSWEVGSGHKAMLVQAASWNCSSCAMWVWLGLGICILQQHKHMYNATLLFLHACRGIASAAFRVIALRMAKSKGSDFERHIWPLLDACTSGHEIPP